jgi:hypothetical protein
MGLQRSEVQILSPRPLSLVIRHPQTTSASARLLTWLLVVGLLLLQGAPFQKRYNCQVTGARGLDACCCTAEVDCSPRDSSCDSGGCRPSEEEDADDGCGCCDIVFEALDSELATVPQLPALAGPALQLARLPAFRMLQVSTARLEGPLRREGPRRWPGPPVYLLHDSLLI